MTEEIKEVQEIEEVKEEVEAPVPTSFKVIVTNTINEVEGEVFSRECEYGKKDTMMKSVRQKIRDMGTTIREATVTFNEDKSVQTIAFKDLVIIEKPKAARSTSTSSAQKNAASTVANETDIEILGIANGDGDQAAKTEALSPYTRHQLIHAYNVHREDGQEKLNHYTTKVQARDALLA